MGRNTVRNCLYLNLSMLLALPLSASTVRIYITNSAGDSVQVIDPATNHVIQEIQGMKYHTGLRSRPMEVESMSVMSLRTSSTLWIERPETSSRRCRSVVTPIT